MLDAVLLGDRPGMRGFAAEVANGPLHLLNRSRRWRRRLLAVELDAERLLAQIGDRRVEVPDALLQTLLRRVLVRGGANRLDVQADREQRPNRPDPELRGDSL